MLYQTRSAVLFIIYKRPDTSARVFEKIREAKPPRLYVAADGPKPDRENESLLCKATRELIQVDWPCEVKILYRDSNMGCKYGVSSAVTWFFEHENEGIILEDDCLPGNDFFRFCDLMLERYRHDTRIRHIAGCNLHYGKKWGNATYYFSNNVHVWGWAAWRRVWQQYDVELNQYHESEVEEQFSKIFNDLVLVEGWCDIFHRLKQGMIDTWDYQVGISNFFNNGLCIIPNYNLVSNIGFRADGTHTFASDDPNANLPLEPLPHSIEHPRYILPEKQADVILLHRDFGAGSKKKGKLKYRIKRLLKLR
ncbi:N-acetyl-alpha-D-glucosaminyl L-malate synthase BshA (plasmid) [Pedobacter sp. BS3]|uniref:N-acetyl-alpha-D-glucosaminyl L-malate synthase BshA n=1 Tax=Pedobacter sp. BS3 TaxID=2567937 RepID=UPI0011EDE755|nr:N-acetyl-alpha-D-glucosaminyl L-malate synthase BshA [Pedobacter sp. BS3]TZF86012.1 N-acetyl-alpha-D-glucosaminyl L-malate synthase BshA [Pedobacter sp. BS3]